MRTLIIVLLFIPFSVNAFVVGFPFTHHYECGGVFYKSQDDGNYQICRAEIERQREIERREQQIENEKREQEQKEQEEKRIQEIVRAELEKERIERERIEQERIEQLELEQKIAELKTIIRQLQREIIRLLHLQLKTLM